MNIAILTRYFAVSDAMDSGIGQHYRILADALADQQHAVHVVYACTNRALEGASLASLAPQWTCELIEAPLPKPLALLARSSWPLRVYFDDMWAARSAAQAMFRAIQQKQIRIIETHSYGAPARALLRATHRPNVVTRVSTTARQVNELNRIHSPVFRWLERNEHQAIHRSDALVTHTLHHRDIVAAQENVPAARFHIIPHGLPDPGVPDFNNDPGRDSVVEFLFVGRFERRKGVDVLLDAIPSVARECPNASFTLAGATADGGLWRTFAQSHPELVDSRVRCLGRIPQVELTARYRSCDVLVAPSRYESFGLIYPEAMAHGKPVIGCRCGGVPEVIQDGVTGLLAEPGDVRSLASAMTSLAKQPEMRRKLGRAGRADFEARFSATRMAANSAEYYARLLHR